MSRRSAANGEILSLFFVGNEAIIDMAFSPSGREIVVVEESGKAVRMKAYLSRATPPNSTKQEV